MLFHNIPNGPVQVAVSFAPTAARRHIAASKRRGERDILITAPEHKQRNAALDILDPAEAAALVAHIRTCRAA